MLLYSVTSRRSFERIGGYRDMVLRVKDTYNVPMLLVACRCDLEEKREISTSEGQELALSLGCSIIETSAKTRYNLEKAIHYTVGLCRRHREEEDAARNNRKQGCVLM